MLVESDPAHDSTRRLRLWSAARLLNRSFEMMPLWRFNTSSFKFCVKVDMKTAVINVCECEV